MEEIRRSPVEVGSLSYYIIYKLQAFKKKQVVGCLAFMNHRLSQSYGLLQGTMVGVGGSSSDSRLKWAVVLVPLFVFVA